jgi:hypothetical protein
LQFGGKFDVGGRWTGAHELHRLGKSADIRTDLYYYQNGSLQHRVGVPVRLPRTEPFNTPSGGLNPNSRLIGQREFERMCSNNRGRARIHLPNSREEHYHIDFE